MRARQTDTDENHALQKCFIQRSADSKPLVISISVVFMSWILHTQALSSISTN